MGWLGVARGRGRGWLGAAISVLLAVPAVAPAASACTRAVWQGQSGQVITARSMDFAIDIPTDLWVLPRGVARSGETGPNSLRWTAKYGSVVASGFDISTTDGVNEAGLNANLLWLAPSEYPEFGPGAKPGLAISLWAQWALDNFATVAEAVAALRAEPFTLVTDDLPAQPGRRTTVHLSLSDATGDSAIIEYVGGRQVIHHGRDYRIMTNEPIYEEQLALNAYWKSVGGTALLPGSSRAADRFVRASFYVDALPKDLSPDVALASMFGVIRNASTPFGFVTPQSPNNSSTIWRVVFDHGRKLYFFDSTFAPNTIWVDLKKLDFSAGSPVRKLELGERQAHAHVGDVTAKFVAAQPFRFQGLAAR
jgi:penicillin V acylase-like amidase (Ntn superfamily)